MKFPHNNDLLLLIILQLVFEIHQLNSKNKEVTLLQKVLLIHRQELKNALDHFVLLNLWL